MTERYSPPDPDREVERIELDVEPFVAPWDSLEEAEERMSDLAKRINVELGRKGIYLALYMGTEPIGTDADAQGIRRVFDEEHIDNAVLEARKRRSIIDDAAARVIASQLHSGQGSAIYALASSGAIVEGLLEEIDFATKDARLDPVARYWAEDLEKYVTVRVQEYKLEHVEGWHKLWLGAEKHDEALVARAQKLYDQDAGWQAFADQFTREELAKLWDYAGDGMTYSFDDEVYDALAQKYDHFNEAKPE